MSEQHHAPRPLCLRLAVVCWLISLCLPTLQTTSRTILGYEVALQFINPFVWLFAPAVLVLASLTNILFLQQVGRISRAGRASSTQPSPAPIAIALLINLIACGSVFGTPAYRAFLPNVFTSPGVWVWLASFVLLLVGILREESPHRPRARPVGNQNVGFGPPAA